MKEYRKLPKGTELISTLGLGTGCLENTSKEEITKILQMAIDNGINFFDLCASHKKVFEAFAPVLKKNREKIYLQIHFGAVYGKNGEYAWSRNLITIKNTINYILKTLETNYIDFGFLHCVDEVKDYEDLQKNGIFDYLKELKAKGIVHHIGFSSHTPSVANLVLDSNLIDLMMFSINPAYDFEFGDELGIGTVKERKELFLRAQRENVAISVMKPFFGGKLLNAQLSPFNVALSKNQCLQYCLDRPGVITCVPGLKSVKELQELLKFFESSKEENDYSIIGTFSLKLIENNCVYCNHCQPCPAHIDIGLINKYYDLALVGDDIAYSHYQKLSINASNCLKCGYCNLRCPFKVNQIKRMADIANYFQKK